MRGRAMCFCVTAMALMVLCGCRSDVERDARRLFEENCLETTKGTPMEYQGHFGKVNEMRTHLIYGGCRNREIALQTYANAYRDIQLGKTLNWKQEKVVVPRLKSAPVIDGVITESEYAEALAVSGECLFNSMERTNQDGIRWFMGWHGDTLYVAIDVADAKICPLDGTEYPVVEPLKRIYMGDCIEFFIRPNHENDHYYEYIVNPNGTFYSCDSTNQDDGFFRTIKRNRLTRAVGTAARTAKGYSVELRIPMREFIEKYLPDDFPKAGDSFTFTIVHAETDVAPNPSGTTSFAVFPLLYNGHNIYSYAFGTLGE